MKPMWVFFFFTALTAFAVADSTTTQPARFKDATVTAGIAADAAAEANAKAEYNKAVIASKTNLILILTTAKVKATKAGDLEEAVRLRDKIASLEAEIAAIKNDVEVISFVIITAQWGVDDKHVDVTKKLQGMIKNGRLELTANGITLGDPAFGKHKELAIVYEINGVRSTERFSDGTKVEIGKP